MSVTQRTLVGWTMMLTVLLSFTAVAHATASKDGRAKSHRPRGLPVSFEANRGQTDPSVKFLARGEHLSLFLAPDEVVFAIAPMRSAECAAQHETPSVECGMDVVDDSSPAVLRMRLKGADRNPQLVGLGRLPGTVNYFVGNDPTKWQTKIPTYATVQYRTVYPEIDLVFYGDSAGLEYDFIVKPGGNPARIRVSYEGAKNLAIDRHGNLVFELDGRTLTQQPPMVYQEIAGSRRTVPGRYVIHTRRNRSQGGTSADVVHA
ncbi:MAG: SBBP repeat-containing protein, partial [Acidimicrobiia bacterium]